MVVALGCVLQVAVACGGRSEDNEAQGGGAGAQGAAAGIGAHAAGGGAGRAEAGGAGTAGHAGNTGGVGNAGGGDPGGGGSNAGQGGALPNGLVELRNAVVYANCTPGVQGDPILASWTADVSSAEGRNQAQFKSATLRVFGPTTVTQHLVVEPSSIGLDEGMGSAEQRKVDADVPPPSMLCFTHCQSTTWTLDVEFDVGQATASGDFACPS